MPKKSDLLRTQAQMSNWDNKTLTEVCNTSPLGSIFDDLGASRKTFSQWWPNAPKSRQIQLLLNVRDSSKKGVPQNDVTIGNKFKLSTFSCKRSEEMAPTHLKSQIVTTSTTDWQRSMNGIGRRTWMLSDGPRCKTQNVEGGTGSLL